jgi:hypothetical protein
MKSQYQRGVPSSAVRARVWGAGAEQATRPKRAGAIPEIVWAGLKDGVLAALTGRFSTFRPHSG